MATQNNVIVTNCNYHENIKDLTNPLINDLIFFLNKNKNKQICYPYKK